MEHICVTHLIDQRAKLHPGWPAVITSRGQTSYGDLMSHVNRFAKRLVDHGVCRETPVAVCSERSLTWIVSTMAVIRAGGVYVPVDPSAPLLKKARILDDNGVRLLLTEPGLLVVLPDSVEVLRMETDREEHGSPGITLKALPDQAVYCIYTSGSAGEPKGVLISNASLANYCSVLRRQLILTEEDRYLQTASLAFSASIRQLVAPLSAGSTIVVAEREDIHDPTKLISWMLESRVTVFDTVPSYLARWLTAVRDSPSDWREGLAGGLRLVLTTGEPLSGDITRNLHQLLPHARLVNLYGQTETTGTVAAQEAGLSDPAPVPIGPPLGLSRFYVLNDRMEPTSEGELSIAGPSLARCYHGRPELTASSFLPDPFSAIPGERMYRTGDRVERCGGNLLRYRGRVDRQVKVHGIRVELDEIDGALLGHPEVEEAATVLRSVTDQDPRLVTFVVRQGGNLHRSCAAENLRRFLAGTLPEPVIPGIFVFLDELPRTVSGKIAWPDLMAKDIAPLVSSSTGIAPRTRLEAIIAQCWEDTLELKGVCAEDDFFDLGGTSIQAIEMTLSLQKLLPQRIPLGALFLQDSRLDALANAIEVELEAAV